MWKKFLVVIISLVGTFSIAYAMNNDMIANSAIPTLTGRISPFSKGDRVIMSTQYKNEYIKMQLLHDQAGGYPANTWFSMTTNPIETGVASYPSSSWTYPCDGNCNLYRDSFMKPYITTLNDSITSFDTSIIKDRIYITGLGSGSPMQQQDPEERKYFIPNSHIMALVEPDSSKNIIPLNANDLSFSVPYYNDQAYSSQTRTWQVFGANGEFLNIPITSTAAIRPAAYVDLNTIVFALEPTGTSNVEAKVEQPVYNSTKVHLSTGKEMKMRYLDSNLNVTLKSSNVNKLFENSDTELELTYGDMTVNDDLMISVLISGEDGNFFYYKNLGIPQSTDVTSSINVSDLPVGTYTVSLVNERITAEDAPTAASALKSMQLEVVEGHTITYTKSPQSGAKLGDYEYNKNAVSGMKIGTIAYDGKGVVPIHYEIVADGNDSSYKNFEISGLDNQGNSSATSLDVKIKASGAPDVVSSTDSLRAGTYKFCIVSKDANGDPVIDVVGQSKVCTSLKIEKTAPSISFTTATQKDIKIGDSRFSDTVITSNKDTISPGDITYALSGGVSSVLTTAYHATNPLGYDVEVASTHNGTGLPATFTLTATLKETDNYLSATTTVNRPVYVYKKISSLDWSASKGSYSSSDVVLGAKVGDLLVKDGVGPYTYELTTSANSGSNYDASDAANNGDFTIVNGTGVAAGTKVDVKTSKSLAIGAYKIQFKVTDAKGDVIYKKIEIIVSAKVQSAVDFKTGAGGTTITGQGLKVRFNDDTTSLFAEGGDSSSAIEYYVALQADQPGGIDPSLYLDVNKANGLLKPKKVGKIKVYALRPGDSTYGDMKSGFMEVEILPAEQTIAFNDTTNPSKVEKGKDIIQDAKGTIKKDGSAGVGGITYASSDTSIATVDANGKVTGVKAGNATITATLNASTSTTYDENYETVSCQKVVNVYEGMKLTWSANASNLKAESSTTGDSAGTINATSNSGNVSYKISTNTGIAENADGSLFNVTPTGVVQLKNKITASDLHNHASNDYKVRVEATDGNGTVSIDIVIHVDDASNTPHFTDKDGGIITSISEVYGEHKNTFQLYSSTSNGLKAVYGLDPSDTNGTVTVDGLGVVKIQKVGNAIAQAVAPSGTGYDGATITIPITITAGEQSITFKDTTTLNQKFVENSTFSDPAELRETSANTITTLRAITYASNTPAVCSIDAAGTITMLTKGMCEVAATNSDANWKSASATKRINLYDGMGVSFGQSNTPQAGSSTAQVGSPIGSLSVSGGQGTKTYAVSSASDAKNKDASFFSINTSGVISLKKAVNASDISSYYDNTKKVYLMHVQFETSDSLGNKVTTDAVVEIQGAKLNASFDTGGEGKITKEYSKDGTFTLNLSSNAGNGTPSYQLKQDSTQPSDVLKSVSTSGLVSIENANDPKVNAKPVMVEAVIPASNGYDGETIEVEVEITKAPQPDFGFKNTTIRMSTESTVTLLYKGKLSDGKVSVTNPSSSDIISIDGMDLATNTKTGTTSITIIDAGNRNYKMAKGNADVIVSDLPAYEFMISVPSAIYGDTGKKATIFANGLEEEHPGAIGVLTWKSGDTTIAEVDDDGNLTIHKAGSVEITCTQTSSGGIPTVTSTVTFVIKPKPITITINDKSKYVGEALPAYDMTIPSGVLVGSDMISLPTFSCVDEAKANVTASTPAGSYDITGSYPTGSNANYAITVKPGKLTVKQDASKATWFHLEGITSNTTLDSTKWHNQDVKVVLDEAIESAGTYNELSLDKTLWDANFISVNEEGESLKDVYFRINASDPAHPLAIATPQTASIKIDKTKPVIKSITGTTTNKDAISTLINKLTFGAYFKPDTKVSIKSEDLLPKPNVKVSGVKTVAYEVYEIDRKTGNITTTPIARGDLTPNASGISEVTMNDAGLYRVCAIPSDNAGNQGTISCSDLNIKNIGVDVDKDGTLDNLDSDKDNCPDIDIVLKDKEDKFYKVNVDRDGDNLPDLNIDSDGDGEADINVDTDDDGKPDVNLLIITKEMWKPTYCVTNQSEDTAGSAEQYCTTKELIPTINVDINNDQIPNINIDINGDMKADLNITKENSEKPFINITTINKWEPKQDYTYQDFLYDTIGEQKPFLNIDSDHDGRADLNLDIDDDGVADLNIDVNGDGIPDVNIDSDGDGKAEINIDPNNDGVPDENIVIITTWKPDKDVDVIKDFPYGTMDGLKAKDTLVNDETGIQIKNPGGAFLPNFAIKVVDIKDTMDSSTKEKVDEFLDDKTEVKDIFDVKLTDGDKQVEPGGSLVVRIPIKDELKGETSIKIIVEQKDGSFKEVDAVVEGDYFVYESDYLGKVGILGAIKQTDPTPNPDPTPDPNPTPDQEPSSNPTTQDKTPSTPNTSVKGSYVSGIGGAITGDNTSWSAYIIFLALSSVVMIEIRRKGKSN